MNCWRAGSQHGSSTLFRGCQHKFPGNATRWRWRLSVLRVQSVVMGADEVLPDRNEPVRAEIVHDSDRTRVTRVFLPGGTVIRKAPLGPEAQRRLRHERAILERLGGAAAAPHLA